MSRIALYLCLISFLVNTPYPSTRDYIVPTDSKPSRIPAVEEDNSNELITFDDVYEEGYNDGYEQGLEDGRNGLDYGSEYDDSSDYYGYFESQYENGYKAGYDEGYSEGFSEFEENEE